MHECKYCNSFYCPRPQVKNPQACNRKKCQLARQRDNEMHWRKRNKIYYGKDYYEVQKEKRNKIVSDNATEFLHCFEVGKNMLNKNINLDIFSEYFLVFFSQLGTRLINKLWT
jgi:hypothetical protein